LIVNFKNKEDKLFADKTKEFLKIVYKYKVKKVYCRKLNNNSSLSKAIKKENYPLKILSNVKKNS
jgi:hypothetical protein